MPKAVILDINLIMVAPRIDLLYPCDLVLGCELVVPCERQPPVSGGRGSRRYEVEFNCVWSGLNRDEP